MNKLACAALALALCTPVYGASESFKDPLDVPATMLKVRLESTHANAVTRAGDRLIVVGLRGLVLLSDDGGSKWVQASVPVASDLTDVYFPTPRDGWAVGHDGVVLRTRDGGNSWEKQLDGRMARKLLTEHFQSLVDSGNAEAERHLQDVETNYADGPEQGLLSVWFEDALRGFVGGSFGTLLATNDGGITWKSWIERVEYDTPLHFYAIRNTKKGVLMASEQGIVFRLDPDRQRFVPMHTGYNGTFFSLVEVGDAVLAVGLRGTAYRLKGDRDSWEELDTGVSSAITAATPLPDGGALVATQMGQLLVTRDGGNSFQRVAAAHPMSYTGLETAAPGTVAATGLGGVRRIPLQ